MEPRGETMEDRNLRLTEAWFRLLADAARGTRAAQSTLRRFAQGQLTAQRVARQLARFLPAGVNPPRPEAIQQWTEHLFKTLGVVPRSRHLELLERYEALRIRLEEAEVTIQRLKRLLSESGHEGDAQKLLDIWSNAVGETLRSQTEWMRGWLASAEEPIVGDESAAKVPPKAPTKTKARRKKRA
jgi:hypothetical protein